MLFVCPVCLLNENRFGDPDELSLYTTVFPLGEKILVKPVMSPSTFCIARVDGFNMYKYPLAKADGLVFRDIILSFGQAIFHSVNAELNADTIPVPSGLVITPVGRLSWI